MLLWTFVYRFLCGHTLISFEYIHRSRIAESCGNFMFNLLKSYQTFTKQLHHFAILPVYEDSSFSTSLLTLAILSFDYSHPNGCEMVSHCGLICISLRIIDARHLPMCLLAMCKSSEKRLFYFLKQTFTLFFAIQVIS